MGAVAPLTLSFLFPLVAIAKPVPAASVTAAWDLASHESLSQAEADAMVSEFMADMTQGFSTEEKNAIALLTQLSLSETDLVTLSELDSATLKASLSETIEQTTSKSADLTAAKRALEHNQLKFSPAVFAAARLAGHMRGIMSALVVGNVVGAIRSAEFDFPAMGRALSTGDTRTFRRLLAEALPGQRTFIGAMASGASFACNAATIDLTPDLCARFSRFTQQTLQRYQRPARRRAQEDDRINQDRIKMVSPSLSPIFESNSR